MADVHTREQRSFNMSRIRARDTKPEMIVRRVAHGLGYRFRLHRRDLPGCPDLVFPRLRKVIFVHGCFWHMHSCRYGSVTPKTRAEFWAAKRRGNVERDSKAIENLKRAGWQALTIWECETRDADHVSRKVGSFLGR
jgi:DNA mismatch endonuclease (patch repair protein)